MYSYFLRNFYPSADVYKVIGCKLSNKVIPNKIGYMDIKMDMGYGH